MSLKCSRIFQVIYEERLDLAIPAGICTKGEYKTGLHWFMVRHFLLLGSDIRSLWHLFPEEASLITIKYLLWHVSFLFNQLSKMRIKFFGCLHVCTHHFPMPYHQIDTNLFPKLFEPATRSFEVNHVLSQAFTPFLF